MAGCDILASMKQKLQSTGLYRLDGSTLVDAELQAYAAAMQALADEIWKLEQEGFVQTAGGDGLELWERACGNVRDTLSTADRREMLCSRLRVTPNDYTAGKLQDALLAAGILAHVAEIENHTVYINVLGTAEIQSEMSPEEIQALAAEFLPAHLEWSFDFGVLSWDYIDGGDHPFDQMDQADFSWDQIDAYAP